MRAAKGKRGQEAVAEDSNARAVAANGEARMVQNAAPKGMGTEEDFPSEQRQKIRRAPSVVAISGARRRGAINDSGGEQFFRGGAQFAAGAKSANLNQ